MRGGYPCVAGSQVCATESVKCWAVPICTAPGDADEVEVAVGGPGVTRRGHGVSLLRHHEGGGGLGAVADGAVALLLSDAGLVVLGGEQLTRAESVALNVSLGGA